MKRLLLIIVAVGACSAALPALASAAPCVLPEQRPLWIDYGAPHLAGTFGRPGVIVAGSGIGYPAQMRATGAQTVYWDMYLSSRVGTPSEPADPSLLTERADRLFAFAVATLECDTPWIVMNELFGASLPTPWTTTTTRYRDNVLQWVRLLAARGAKPILLVSSEPFVGPDAAPWWRDVAEHADIVLEKYFAAPAISKAGPELGSRRMRTSMRRSAAALFSIHVPPEKLGFMLAFQTGNGVGGREGLKPASKWLEVAKLQALAAKQVSQELGTAHVWSWGWGIFNEAGNDPDKAGAACVWLWARDPALCDAPGRYAFDADRRAGQIDLPGGIRCTLRDRTVTLNAIGDLTRVTGDAELALSALVRRIVEQRSYDAPTAAVLAAERTIVAIRFGGKRSAYLAALRSHHATLALSRAVLADELRRRELQGRLRVGPVRASHLAEFQTTYGGVLAREIAVAPAPAWLPSGRGVALATQAPARVFTLRTGATARIRTTEGVLRVTALEDTVPLAAVPFPTARPALVRALRGAAQENAYRTWTARAQNRALDEIRCVGDRIPAVGAVDLTSFLPFLMLEDGTRAG